jgi:hypothetical protein
MVADTKRDASVHDSPQWRMMPSMRVVVCHFEFSAIS